MFVLSECMLLLLLNVLIDSLVLFHCRFSVLPLLPLMLFANQYLLYEVNDCKMLCIDSVFKYCPVLSVDMCDLFDVVIWFLLANFSPRAVQTFSCDEQSS